MADKKVEDYAFEHGLSNKEAKRRMKSRKREGTIHVVRGVPIAGTGKPGGE